MPNRALYLFPDTNLFIQCLPLQQIDWTQWDDFDEVHLLVSRPVQREIDNQKNRGNDRVGQRARKTYQTFRDIATGEDGYEVIRESGPRVELYLEALSRPSPELEDRLDYSKPDDEIVGCCYRYSREHPSSDVRLLTHDGGPMMTARSLGMPFVLIPDSWLLAPENSLTERENARLKEEINRLKKAEPEFTIRCVDAGDREIEVLEFQCQIFEPLTESEISELIEALKSRYPVSSDFTPTERPRRDNLSSASPLDRIIRSARIGEVFVPASQQEIAKYRKEDYPEWIGHCRRIFSNLHLALQRSAGRPAIHFLVENGGARLGKDALLDIISKGNLEVSLPWDEIDDRPMAELQKDLRLPPPPKPPRGRWESPLRQLTRLRNWITDLPSLAYPNALLDDRDRRRDPNGFYYKPRRPNEPVNSFSLECEQWRHGIGEERFDVEICVSTTDDVAGVIECVVHAENLSAPIRKAVRVNGTVQDGNTREHAFGLISALSGRL